MDEKAKKHLQFIEHIHHLDNKGQLVLIPNSDANKETLKAKWPSIIVLNKNEYFMRFASNVEMQVNYYFQRKHQTGQNSLIIKDRCRLMKIPLKNLRYIESNGMHKIRFVGPNLQYEFYLPLNQVEVLHEDLLRIHRSFIVNKHAVKDVSRGKRIVQLKDNTLLPLSRTCFSEVIDDLEKVCQ
ncbi:LytTR family transcriptional regulator [Enterococcus cecorum]|uniref:LytTR family DNA-binding domain-containing protein n=3 Tax=Enterococcus cecorum TaxID=44008 RepID=UPI000A68BFED|nr:LytTR family DNA-binding domain-containing protein [Enterococcus cecorum]MCJ0555644.1 LytTR family transcriptional regulator DNA-binding domain-containing protein [Enterococcus cecorum]MDZ5502500.1 LytTR family DNA-binding domain-containing protein [Enterococcus cecorum]MDZ5582075.1 LytTR family DNA-binding domain-containing protein [Enterococcus cecorum]CAI3254028.1 LytTR family transcriptional regulator [Enterococcus cecorum]CAI3272552.1 LytTR family transcriptional regulator [Enterococcu